MKSLFNLDSPIFQLLSRLADLVIVNLLFLLCSIPIVTIGAAAAAAAKVTQGMVLGEEGKIASAFFQAFKSNFKQATIAWVVILVILVGMVLDYLLITSSFTGTTAQAMLVLLVILALLAGGVSCYLFPLLARYRNTLWQHLSNAVILSLAKLPRTLGMLVLHSFALVLLAISPAVFVQTLIFWIAIGFAFVAYMDSLLLRPVFRQLEAEAEEED